MKEDAPRSTSHFESALLREAETFFLHEGFGESMRLLNEVNRLLKYPRDKKAKERCDVLLTKVNLEWPYYGESLPVYGKVFTPQYDAKGIEVSEYRSHTAQGEEYTSRGFVVHPMHSDNEQQLCVWAMLDDGALMSPYNFEASIPYDAQEALLTRLLHFQAGELEVINELLCRSHGQSLDAMRLYQPHLYTHDTFYRERVVDLEAYLTQIMDFDNELPSLVQVSDEKGENHQYVMQPKSIILTRDGGDSEGLRAHSLHLSGLRHSSSRAERPLSVTIPIRSVTGITPIRQLER